MSQPKRRKRQLNSVWLMDLANRFIANDGSRDGFPPRELPTGDLILDIRAFYTDRRKMYYRELTTKDWEDARWASAKLLRRGLRQIEFEWAILNTTNDARQCRWARSLGVGFRWAADKIAQQEKLVCPPRRRKARRRWQAHIDAIAAELERERAEAEARRQAWIKAKEAKEQ